MIKFRNLAVIETVLTPSSFESALDAYSEYYQGDPPHTIMVHPMRKILAKEIVRDYPIRVFTIRIPIETWMLIGANGIIYSDGTDL